MKKFLHAALIASLATSMLQASPVAVPEERLIRAIELGDVRTVEEVLQAGSLDINKGLGKDLKPALMLAIEKLGYELKEHGHDIAWYLIATGFGAIALTGLYAALEKSDSSVVFTPEAESNSVAGEATKGARGSKANKPVWLEQKNGKGRLANIFMKISGGVAGMIGSIKKAREKGPVRTASTEDRLQIVRLLAQHPDTNIFAADAHGRNSLDAVVSYLSGYNQGSECYNCMKEAQESLTKNKKAELLYAAWLNEDLEDLFDRVQEDMDQEVDGESGEDVLADEMIEILY